MQLVDEILASPSLQALQHVNRAGGERRVEEVRLAERFGDLDHAPAGSFVVLSRACSADLNDYRVDMALRWGAIHQVVAVAAFSEHAWRPSATAADIAARGDIALVSIPPMVELTWLLLAISREIGGGAELALKRAESGLLALDEARIASVEDLCLTIGRAIGVPVEFREPLPGEVSAPVVVGDAVEGHLTAAGIRGDLATAVRLVLHAGAAATGRMLDTAKQARELPIRSRSELLAELLLSEASLNEDLLSRARQLGIPVDGWHVAVRIELENLDEVERAEVRRFELLEAAAHVALQAAMSSGGIWYPARIARAIVLVRMTSSDPGPQAGGQAAKAALRAVEGIQSRFPVLRARGGVGAAHEGPLGLRASAAEARTALSTTRATGERHPVATYDAVGVRRMLMEWYASDTARESVRTQLAPLERLGSVRAETAIRTLKTYLDEQGSIVRTASVLHLHRNAVMYRLRRITDLLGTDLSDPDQRLALQLACRARLLE